MKAPWANIALLIFLLTLAVSGYLGLVSGYAGAEWRLWLHGIAAYGLIILFVWKGQIILDAYRRKKRWTRERIAFSAMLFLLLLTVLLGLLWTFNGPIYIGGFSLVSLHIYLALPMMLLLVWHVRRMKFIFKVKGTLGRRLFLGTAVSTIAGVLLGRVVRTGQEAAGLAGAGRRFTGSYEQGSFSGVFPAVSWILDDPPPVNPDDWALRVEGAVARPFTLTYAQLLALPAVKQDALLDCTGGWYTVQSWEGVPLKTVLDQAELLDAAASITIEAISGYRRRFALSQIDRMLLAYRVDQAALAHRHGAPLRLVIPGRRGFEWVKWVAFVRVNTTSAIWQSPLPLR